MRLLYGFAHTSMGIEVFGLAGAVLSQLDGWSGLFDRLVTPALSLTPANPCVFRHGR